MSQQGGSAKIGRTLAESQPFWPPETKAAKGSPNILVVLFDDVGFSDFGCYGSPIRTPTIDALAADGLRYTGFHTTAMCSTTRAALLTGRNHHSVGMGCLANFDSGFPGYRGKISREAGTLPEILRANGYGTYMVGKWHATPLSQTGAAGPYDGWPLGRGFNRYYGFMDAETDQFSPELVRDNTPVDPPRGYADGYHLTEDLIDESIRFVADHIADAPDQPWLLWLALGACHAPHQAPMDIIRSYDDVFAEGWDAERERRLERQKALGIVPPSTELPARNEGVKPWAEHSADEQKVFTRLQSAFAGMLDHADRHLARLVAFLEQAGVKDDTLILVLSDNGASQEGGPLGFVNAMGPYNLKFEPIPEKLAKLEDVGGPDSHSNFPHGWAMASNTPPAPLQAEHPWRRHPRSAGGELEERPGRPRRAASPVRPCLRPDADPDGPAGDRAAGRHRRGGPDADGGGELRRLAERAGRAVQGRAAVFRDVRPPGPLARRLEGRRVPSAGSAVR
jgi:arylsulfatase A-like enzyme